jgi:hypothetical protein
MTHTVTWECAWCKRRYASVQGSKFKLKEGYKRRKCKECLCISPPAKTVAGDGERRREETASKSAEEARGDGKAAQASSSACIAG